MARHSGSSRWICESNAKNSRAKIRSTSLVEGIPRGDFWPFVKSFESISTMGINETGDVLLKREKKRESISYTRCFYFGLSLFFVSLEGRKEKASISRNGIELFLSEKFCLWKKSLFDPWNMKYVIAILNWKWCRQIFLKKNEFNLEWS